MSEQNNQGPDDWADQQYVVNEAASVLEELREYLIIAEGEGGLSLHGMATIQASLMILREILLERYGLMKKPLLDMDVEDFMEFVVNEANQ